MTSNNISTNNRDSFDLGFFGSNVNAQKFINNATGNIGDKEEEALLFHCSDEIIDNLYPDNPQEAKENKKKIKEIIDDGNKGKPRIEKGQQGFLTSLGNKVIDFMYKDRPETAKAHKQLLATFAEKVSSGNLKDAWSFLVIATCFKQCCNFRNITATTGRNKFEDYFLGKMNNHCEKYLDRDTIENMEKGFLTDFAKSNRKNESKENDRLIKGDIGNLGEKYKEELENLKQKITNSGVKNFDTSSKSNNNKDTKEYLKNTPQSPSKGSQYSK